MLNFERAFKTKVRSCFGKRNSFRNFAYVSSYLNFKNFVWKLPNIYRTVNVRKLTKVILKSSQRVLQESLCLICCMIFKETYFSICVSLIVSQHGFSYITKKSRQKFKYLEKEKRFEDETKLNFCIIFKNLQLPKIVSDLRLGLKHIRAAILCESDTDFKFSITINYYCQSSKLSSCSLSKSMLKIPISDLNKRDHLLNFVLYSKSRHFSMTNFDIIILCNILHFEMNFKNLH